MEELLVNAYRRVMSKYLADRVLVPDGPLAEVRFEDLERNPLGELERLYAELVPAWQNARTHIEAYLQTLSGYRKNSLRFDQSIIDRVDEHWRFAVDAWNYQVPTVEGK